jgi:toxin ParE1/3/4
LRVLDRIDKSAQSLGQIATGRSGRVADTYEKSVSRLPYIIAYALQPLPSGRERIVILRVIHSARNWPAGEWPK